MWLDRGIMRSMNNFDIPKLLLCFMVGFVILQPLGNLLEMLVSSVAAVIVALVLGRLLNSRARRPSRANAVNA
jgi:hypothetical protein